MAKIAVYTIALNEEKHVARWYRSAKDADLLLIADTGSTDRTVEVAEELGITVHHLAVKPWRFDVARNASLALIPDDVDICIQLDVDEVLMGDWRAKVEAAFEQGIDWPLYKHVNGWDREGKPVYFQWYFKIHPRHGFTWRYPIHEIIEPLPGTKSRRETIDLEVWHLQDQKKARSYLSLLEMGATEAPTDWRMNHYLTREYWYAGNHQKVIESAYKTLKISGGWDIERASTCIWASEAAWNLGNAEWSLEWARRACEESPRFYEAWHWRARTTHFMELWHESYISASKIDTLPRMDTHLTKHIAWAYEGFDLAAFAAYRLGYHREAIYFGERAIAGNPDDQRLQTNLVHYKSAYESSTARFFPPIQKFSGESTGNLPKVLVAILAKNKEKMLPQYLQSLTKWDYPKKQMILWIHTNDNDDATSQVLKDWIDENRRHYSKVIFHDEVIDPSIKSLGVHEWNSTRFKILGKIRDDSLNATLLENCEYYFVSDVDNFLSKDTLSKLVSYQLPIVAPFLKNAPDASGVFGMGDKYSNFHAEIDKNGYFKESDSYHQIWSQNVKGLISVDLVHCTYLVKADFIPKLAYQDETARHEYVIFAEKARSSAIKMYLDNSRVYGYLTFATDGDVCAKYLEQLAATEDKAEETR